MEEEDYELSNTVDSESKRILEEKANDTTFCRSEEELVKCQVAENALSYPETSTDDVGIRPTFLNELGNANAVSCNAVENIDVDQGINPNSTEEDSKKQISDNDKVPDEIETKHEQATTKRLSKIDFTVLEESFYRRYKSFFNNDADVAKIDLSQDKRVVSKMINEHFSSFEINPVDVIRTFLVLRKNSENSHGHFIMSPAQSPEPNIPPVSEGNGRSRRCTNKDVNSVINEIDSSINDRHGINSFKSDYKTENSTTEHYSDIGVSTRNSRKGRISGRGKK